MNRVEHATCTRHQSASPVSSLESVAHRQPGLRHLPEILAALAAAVCFLGTLGHEFCYDDIPIVAMNPRVQEAGQWRAVWTTDYWSHQAAEGPARDLLYRPVTISTLRVVRQLFGPSAFPQRLLNILLHVAASVMVVCLARRIGAGIVGSSAAGVLFAVLPIHTEAVASVVGRADLLGTVGVLAALLLHGGFVTSRRSAFVILSAACLFVALGSKESTICLLAFVPAFDFYLAATSSTQAGRRLKRPWVSLLRAAYVAFPAVAYLALRYHALGGQLHQRPAVSKTINLLVDAPAWQHWLGVMQLWGMYWAKTLWPEVLTIGYAVNAVRLATTWLDPDVLLGFAASGLLMIAVVVGLRRRRLEPLLLVIGLTLAYLPTANALVLIQVFFAERLWYLPSVFVCVLVGWWVGRPHGWPQRLTSVVLALAAIAMLVRCAYRNAEWRNNGTLYAAAYRDQPDSIASLHLYGLWLTSNGRAVEGIELLRRAVEMDLGFTDAHRAIGHAYLAIGEAEAALRHLQIADMQVPNHEPTVRALNAARAKLAAGVSAELETLARAAADDPSDNRSRLELVRRLRELGRVDDALRELEQADGRFGEDSGWQREFAITLVMANRVEEAISRYHRAVNLDAAAVAARIELAMLLLERRAEGDLGRAAALAAEAGGLAPDDPLVLACEAEVRALQGDAVGAIERYRRAISALPAESELRRVYQQRVRVLGG